jgi:hypothetical protein
MLRRDAVRPPLGYAGLVCSRAIRGEAMHHDHRSDFGVFLLEDVILTLGNIQGTLGWLTGSDVTPEMRQLGLERIDRQVTLLTGRVQALWRQDGPSDSGAAASIGPRLNADIEDPATEMTNLFVEIAAAGGAAAAVIETATTTPPPSGRIRGAGDPHYTEDGDLNLAAVLQNIATQAEEADPAPFFRSNRPRTAR